MNDKSSKDEPYSEEEIALRRDEALLRALNTPPKHHSEMKIGKRKVTLPKDRKSKKKV
jgi:hypothetical protein